MDYVIHAADMKQVPASEYNPTESIKTNITSSENVISAVAECGVKKVIVLSTDKAVNPINLMAQPSFVPKSCLLQRTLLSGARNAYTAWCATATFLEVGEVLCLSF